MPAVRHTACADVDFDDLPRPDRDIRHKLVSGSAAACCRGSSRTTAANCLDAAQERDARRHGPFLVAGLGKKDALLSGPAGLFAKVLRPLPAPPRSAVPAVAAGGTEAIPIANAKQRRSATRENPSEKDMRISDFSDASHINHNRFDSSAWLFSPRVIALAQTA
jgi:hypothetical protein